MGRNSQPPSVARLAACRLLKCLGFVPTFRQLYIVELAIETESNFSQVGIAKATAIIFDGAQAALQRGECVNYFWFEDCCWRNPKLSFKQRDEMRLQREATIGT